MGVVSPSGSDGVPSSCRCVELLPLTAIALSASFLLAFALAGFGCLCLKVKSK